MSSPFRLFEPVAKAEATGAVAAVYRHAEQELGTVGPPLMALSQAPEILTATWIALRESLLVGDREERVLKEIVALSISRDSGCSYCTSAHGFLLHAAGAHDLAEDLMQGEVPSRKEYASIAEWARSTFADSRNRATTEGPFPVENAPRIVGTALFFHFFSRMVQALTTDTMFPAEQSSSEAMKSMITPAWRKLFDQDLRPARRSELEAYMPSWMGEIELAIPEWSHDAPVGTAWARLKATAFQGRGLVSEETAGTLEVAIARYLDNPPTRGDWIESEIEPISDEKEAARLVLLAAVEPSRITSEDVETWQGTTYFDHCVTFLLAYGAIAATTHIEQTLVEATCSGAFGG